MSFPKITSGLHRGYIGVIWYTDCEIWWVVYARCMRGVCEGNTRGIRGVCEGNARSIGVVCEGNARGMRTVCERYADYQVYARGM